MEKRTIFQRFFAVFYPERCCCCGKVINCGMVVCKECLKKLDSINFPICKYCGRHISDCTCEKHQKHMERCIAPFYYSGAAKAALMRLKFYNKIESAELFTISMAKIVIREYADIHFDYIVPVPISTSTRAKRGYNQSTVLAEGLSKNINIPYYETLVKLWDTKPQRELPAYRRSGNVLGAFDIDGKIVLEDKSILIVDDIATTGATLDECAKILKIYGARKVYAVTATASRLSKKE